LVIRKGTYFLSSLAKKKKKKSTQNLLPTPLLAISEKFKEIFTPITPFALDSKNSKNHPKFHKRINIQSASGLPKEKSQSRTLPTIFHETTIKNPVC
jgi:hypothetical protein